MTFHEPNLPGLGVRVTNLIYNISSLQDTLFKEDVADSKNWDYSGIFLPDTSKCQFHNFPGYEVKLPWVRPNVYLYFLAHQQGAYTSSLNFMI